MSLVKVELRSSTAIGGVLYVVTTGGLRKLSWCADSWATPLQQIIGGIVIIEHCTCFYYTVSSLDMHKTRHASGVCMQSVPRLSFVPRLSLSESR